MRTRSVAVLLFLLASGLPLPVGQAAADPAVEWWGPLDNTGWHFRIPVTVRNDYAYPLTDPVVVASLDLAQLLLDAGWPTETGRRPRPESFALDVDSVRVTQVRNFRAPTPGGTDGRLVAADLALPASDPMRFVVPSFTYPGSFFNADEDPFDSRDNPFITVVWRSIGALAPGQERFHHVYFDSLLNGDKPPAPKPSGLIGGQAESVFGPGPGLELYGVSAITGSDLSEVKLIGLHDGTDFVVHVADGPGTWRAITPPLGSKDVLMLDKDQTTIVPLGPKHITQFRVQATKPVQGMVKTGGFIPSAGGSMLGTEFVFWIIQPPEVIDDFVYFMAADPLVPTRVRVEPLQNQGPPLTYQFGGPDRPFMLSARSGTPNVFNGCRFDNPPGTDPLLPGMGLYRARVLSGGPVLAQHQPVASVHQAPDRWGRPFGVEFYAGMAWRMVTNGGITACAVQNVQGNWMAASMGHSRVNATHPDFVSSSRRPIQIDPPGSDQNPFPAGRLINPPHKGLEGPFPANFPDRPLTFSATGADVALFAGVVADPARPKLSGPYTGSEGARRFIIPGPVMIVAPFEGTTAEISGRRAGSGVFHETLSIPRGEFRLVTSDDKDLVLSLLVNTTRPVIINSYHASSGYMAGVPAYVSARLEPVQFRGYRVDVASPTGLNPVTASTLPGEPLQVPLRVTNLGRNHLSQPLEDTVQLTVTANRPGWTTSFDRDAVTLPGQASSEFLLTLTPSESVETGTLTRFTVTARSQGNRAVTDTQEVLVSIRRGFDVSLWLEAYEARKQSERFIGQSQSAQFPLVVTNEGSVQDTFALTTTAVDPDWSVLIRDGATDVREITLEADESRVLTLTIVPPVGSEEGVQTVSVTAVSLSSPAEFDRVTGSAILRAPSQLRLEVDRRFSQVAPGVAATFRATLINDGRGAAATVLNVSQLVSGTWSTAQPIFRDPVTGEARLLERVTLSGGERIPFRVEATPGAANLHGDTASIRIHAESEQGDDGAEAVVMATVGPAHRLTVGLPGLPLRLAEGARSATVSATIHNQGNLVERLRIRAAEVPAGWTLNVSSETLIQRDQQHVLPIQIRLPAVVPPGAYRVAITLQSTDGNVTRILVPIHYGSFAQASVLAGDPVRTRPGIEQPARLHVRNEGNVELVVEPGTSGGWPFTFPSLVLMPGEHANLTTLWQVPLAATEAEVRQQANLVFVARDGASRLTRFVNLTFQIGLPDLTIQAAEAFPGPAGALVHVTVRNVGGRDASGVQVVLSLANGSRLDAVTIEQLPAGRTTNLTLFAGLEAAPWNVHVDPGNRIIEKDEQNNAFAVTGAGPAGTEASRTSAHLGPLWWLASLAACAVALRRRARDPA